MQPSQQLTLPKTNIDQRLSNGSDHLSTLHMDHNSGQGNPHLEPIQNSLPFQPEKPVTSHQPGECLACTLMPSFFSHVKTHKTQSLL